MIAELRKVIGCTFSALLLAEIGCSVFSSESELEILDRRIPFISFDRATYVDAIEATFLYAKLVGEEFRISIRAKYDCVVIKIVDTNGNLNLDMIEKPETDNRFQTLVNSTFYNQTVREILESITSQTKFTSVIMEHRGTTIKLIPY